MTSRMGRGTRRRRAAWSTALVVAMVGGGLVGMATASPAATGPPSGPRFPSAAPLSGRARVHWTAPRSAGSARVTSYVVTPYRGGTPGARRVFTSRATTEIVTGLKNGKAYSFKVAARSAAGTGPASQMTAAIVIGAPTSPRSVTGLPRNGKAAVSWAAPVATNGSAITAYIVTAVLRSGVAKTQTFAGHATTRIVTGLRNGVRYRFSVRAKNARGAGPPSPPSNAVVPRRPGASKPPTGGYFAIKPPGATLPSAAACAARVHQSTWEPRSDNSPANHTVPKQPVQLAGSFPFTSAWQTADRPRITGNYKGTTDEIIQWAACKWGWSDNIVRAQAVVESHWHQLTQGDFESRAGGHCPYDISTDPCPTSFGIIQVRWYFHPSVSSSTAAGTSYPAIRTSTAFNLDLELAEMRGCYDGRSTYLGNTRGDLWGCLGVWFSGAWHTSGGDGYASRVRSELAAKQWLSWPNEG